MWRVSPLRRALGSTASIKRLEHFAKLEAADVDYLKGVTNVVTAPDDLERFNTDWLKLTKGRSALAVRPETTAEVSKVLRYCNDRKLAVCPQGGNTGLVGGATPVFDEVILSLERMNKIINIDEKSGVGIFEAGCVLETANAALEDRSLLFPLDLGAKGSCHVGGNIATNAGGLRVLRYGNLHGSVLGLEFVKADGKVVDVLSRNKKDNTGIDLKQLLIGSEGILGVITKAAVQCPPLSRAKHVLLLSVDSYAEVVSLFQNARSELGEILSAYEFWDSEATGCISSSLKLPIPDFMSGHLEQGAGKFAVLVETSGSNADHDSEKLFTFLESAVSSENGSIAAGGQQYQDFWRLREDIPEAMIKDATTMYAYDVTLPDITHLYDLVTKSREFFKSQTSSGSIPEGLVKSCVGYGHVGDGNLHINVSVKDVDSEGKPPGEALPGSGFMIGEYEPFLWKLVQDFGGSISAEHGIGSAKTDAIHYSKSPEALQLMRDLKRAMDPNQILNPYKVLPLE
ncbi:unnamed protein product [Amoebophrya sp. A25]|nr:unnamed protein product [Amoebophrya sp. A25]|eukprot:GSA25T00009531001.1